MSSIGLSWAHVGPPPNDPEKSKGLRRLTIFASKLAGCAGMHPYVSRDDMRLELRHALFGDAPEGYLPPKEVEARALKTGMTPAATEALERAVDEIKASGAAADSVASAEAVDRATSLVSDMEGVSEEAKEVVRARLFTAHGTHGEDAIREATQADSKGALSIRTDARFRSTRIATPPGIDVGFDVYVGGRHDGIVDAEGCVTEIKNRVRRHLGVPEYERVQLHAYMAIFGVRKGLLVENYKGDRRQHEVAFDDEFWRGVQLNLFSFLGDLGLRA